MPAATSQITSEDPNSPPKGILKPLRYRFLEEPYPFRQGLPSSSNTENISPDGRYTNLDRRLVNPEALKLGGERSEERSGYVRVSRYLSKEEIQAYAIRTHKLRDSPLIRCSLCAILRNTP
ncbi:hypothetical protein BDV35DRAFT_228751 [Aspergillus flavus]|uniref:DUF8035 domain-containing protein n=1 Tax=Aspergillus flavus TaxID=5059 RepID=A0A5N6GX61_ASPFL|nr:hypothetical protein BDV35DRAFT_228751 [Aspergillus flavus]